MKAAREQRVAIEIDGMAEINGIWFVIPSPAKHHKYLPVHNNALVGLVSHGPAAPTTKWKLWSPSAP